MRKTISILSLLGIVISLALFWFLSQPITKVSASVPFEGFPLNEARHIDFQIDEETFSRLSEREQKDQLRDWLLFTVASDSGLSLEKINQSLFDVPPIRYGYARPVANFEYSDTRSLYIGDGQVIALLPADQPDERMDQLARIADRQRNHIGEIPESQFIFEYQIDPDLQSSRLTQREPLDGQELFTSRYGYYEAEITTLDQLEALLAQIDDITFVEATNGTLTLGGRKIQGHDYLGIEIEDIAAIWQAHVEVRDKLEAFDRRWDQKVEEFNDFWASKTYRTTSQRLALERQQDEQFEELMLERAQEQLEQNLVGGLGFSLDPVYDYDGLANYFEEFKQSSIWQEVPGAEATIAEVESGLAQQDVIPLLKLADQLSHDPDLEIAISGEWLNFVIDDLYRFQAARYDGNLQGTEVGMTLFYTDLLAKLWALDYHDSTPEHIEGFIAYVNRQISSIYRQEWEEISSTRLWFGAQNNGFQVGNDGNSLHFARVATRVYAASSNPLDPGNEVEANTPSSLFLGWWNDHYEEVARYEPQYQRLNEIMKWSLLVSWLGEADRENQLDFLAEVEVNRSNWFPDWVKRQPNLRFQEWEAIEFHQEGYLGTETETIPILYSEPYSMFIDDVDDPWTLSGGVSLANMHLFDDIVPISSFNIDDVLLRPGMVSTDDALGLTLRTADNIEYRFTSLSDDVVSVTSHATKQGARLRHIDSEVANQPFERIANRGLPGTGVKFETRVNGANLGVLEIGPARNGFAVGWVSRDIDVGQQLALKLSRGEPMRVTLQADPNVKAVIQLSGENHFLVKMEGSESWVRIGVEDSPPSTDIPDGWQSRVADPEEGVDNILIAWGDDVKVPDGGHIVSDASDNNFLRYASTDPPSGVRSVEITGNSSSISVRAEVDLKTGKVYYDFDGLPQRLKDDPDLLQGLMSSSDIGKISPPPPKVLRYVPEGEPLDRLILVENMASKNHKALAHQIAADPDAIKRMLDDELVNRLTHVDDLLANSKPAEALEELDNLIKLYGFTPELTLRKGMAQVDLGQLKQTAATLNESTKKPLRNPERFFDEINARMAKKPEPHDNLSRIAQFGDWNDALGRKQVPNGKVVAVVDDTDQTLKLDYHLDDALIGGGVDISSVGNDRLVYVQDLPGFNNLDWSPGAVQRSLQQVVSGNLGTVIALPRGDITHFKPTRIYTPNGTQFNLPVEQDRPVPLRYIPFRRSLDGECETVEEEPCPVERVEEEQVIVVIANE